MNADILVKVHGRDSKDLGRKIDEIDALARTPQEVPPGPPDEKPPGEKPPVEPPVEKLPYFDIGDSSGKAGEVVELSVEGGCALKMDGFHIGGGVGLLPAVERSGYHKFEAIGVKLGAFLTAYLKAEDAIHDQPNHQHYHFWSIFQFMKWEDKSSLPEEWWEYAIGFFSIDQKLIIPPTTIPSGTELFTLHVKILPGTPPGDYEVTCKDVYYYTNSRPRRRDFMYTTNDVPSGHTKLDLEGGKITVVA